MPTEYEQQTRGELRPFIEREWLLTNGIGGFASGTVVGVNTRRYHALLVAAALPPVGRVVALSRLVEVLLIDGLRIDFSAGLFGPDLIGDGVRLLRRFRLAGEVAQWEYELDGVRVVKELLVCWERNACGVRYRITRPSRGGEMTLRLSPLVGLRDFHALRHEGQADFTVEAAPRSAHVTAGGHTLHLECDAGRFEEGQDWWRGFTYPVETDRGMDDREDLFTPGAFVIDCGEVETAVTLWAGLARGGAAGLVWEQELDRRRRAMSAVAGGRALTPTQRRLARAAADFVVKRHRPDGGPGTTVIAGYPWFADWGRDTFISLPGLFLATGRHAEAGQTLATFAHHVSEGMIPNRFDDYTNQPLYNTADASLWFIHAAHEYARVTGDTRTFERELRPACRAIIEGYTRGTRFGIRVDPADGLVTAGDETTQLTWMDAKRDGVVFTPRHGKAVEINALWYHALCLLGERERAEGVRRSFVATFFDPSFGLIDVVTPAGADRSIRPNQIFAVSLPHSPLSMVEQCFVVSVVMKHLLTPFGLRTLAPGDLKYHPRFAGPVFERDRAYHNGTVWPWLIGAFMEAWLKVNEWEQEAVAQARGWLAPLIAHLEADGCLGSISEVFDADPPHRPGGCFAQAWSVAEVLRLAVMLEI